MEKCVGAASAFSPKEYHLSA